ncbi:DGQHR domain-containing protein [Flavobacterium sp. HSC-32F16]|uniref:DGQHR domain-containing protein n=1 Tax=Flavobacterium sp. HSC-32F16 TaxID=2910964 RepID=UPI0020A367A1|nr:DGQHR domain-containing protein [Flavobacterium sp. HSC-32F16]MCP2025750.1 DGQHR domain-containing protein [Flavobacterium sp. HSC-32F16]
MNFPGIKYKQSKYDLVSTVLPFGLTNRLSNTLIYGIDEGGYQRAQDEKHYLNIKKYIETKDFIFPNSIILAIDETRLKDIVKEDKGDGIVYFNFEKIDSQIFRVVDGQHRLLGLENALKNDSSLNDLGLQISIIITPENKRSIEMEIFSNINSKAKRLKTDLIELAKYDYRIIENKIGKSELTQHIAINTAYYLNEDFTIENVWQNAIKIDIHSEFKIGIIGVKAFSEAISGIILSYINKHSKIVSTLENQELIDFSRNSAKEISNFIIESWKIVNRKWPNAFLDPHKVIDIDSQYKSIVYNPSFYIQKTLGCKSINYIISDLLKNHFENTFNSNVLSNFEEIIFKSRLNDYDWILGKTLSGISSESGFNKVSRIIKNEEDFVRKE